MYILAHVFICFRVHFEIDHVFGRVILCTKSWGYVLYVLMNREPTESWKMFVGKIHEALCLEAVHITIVKAANTLLGWDLITCYGVKKKHPCFKKHVWTTLCWLYVCTVPCRARFFVAVYIFEKVGSISINKSIASVVHIWWCGIWRIVKWYFFICPLYNKFKSSKPYEDKASRHIKYFLMIHELEFLFDVKPL